MKIFFRSDCEMGRIPAMQFKPIRTKRIYEEIIEQIKLLIVEGNLKPGDKLLAERELAEKLGVSRTSVREALSALEMMGVIEIRPGEGTFIRHNNMDQNIKSLELLFLMNQDAILEMLELRKILEVAAVGLASERATDDHLAKMEKALKEMEYDIAQDHLGEEADINFHYAVAEATGNSILLRLMSTISDTMKLSVRANRESLYKTPGMPHKLLEEHKQIFQGIKKRDKDEAQNHMLQHLVGVEDVLGSRN